MMRILVDDEVSVIMSRDVQHLDIDTSIDIISS
jgi:hypothetical protein